jgi:outer membrane biosynthesis protein TonB
MKFPNILLSVFLHAGLIVGMVCGSQYQDEVEAEPAEPVFFEILEECAVTASEPVEAVKSRHEAKPETEPSLEKPTNSINENLIRNEFSDEVDEAHVREEAGNVGASDREETEEVEEEDKKKGVADNDERREERDEAKPAELEQAKVVSVPMALNRIVPVYPRSARRRGREGVVTVEISVSDSGEVSGVEVIAGSGYKDLD